MEWKQTEFVHKCPASTAWLTELFYSNMYPPNMTVKWIDTDKPNDALFTNDNITYRFNEYGFRSDSFYKRSDVNILISGCSLSVGIGVEVEKTWAKLLQTKIEKELNKTVTVWNISLSGSSPDYVVRSLYKVFPVLRSEYIFVYWPPLARLELPDSGHPEKISQLLLEDSSFPKELVNEMYLESNFTKNKIMCKRLFHSVRFNGSTDVKSRTLFTNSEDVPFKTYARDRQHPGEEWHENVAQMFFDQWLLEKDK